MYVLFINCCILEMYMSVLVRITLGWHKIHFAFKQGFRSQIKSVQWEFSVCLVIFISAFQ